MNIKKMQIQYVLGGILLIPALPFLFLQGRYVRRKVGRLPDASGETVGIIGIQTEVINLLAIGESTVAGVGAETHAGALTGQFAKHLSAKIGKTVSYVALGESGITARGTLQRLVPKLPQIDADIILVALGGNDVFTLNSPRKWRRNLSELLAILRKKYPNSKILVANVPMVRDFIALPNPLRFVLSKLAKLHHFNASDLIKDMKNVFYFDEVRRVDTDFFSDGIHPSPKGYDQWAASMVDFLARKIG